LENGGTLYITLARENISGDVANLVKIPDGAYGKLTVVDTGEGIPPENIDRIFEPYFTTKEDGKGTGLGLAAVHGIIKSHDGAISVKSRIGEGTIFDVYLPLTKELEDKEQEETSQEIGGSEHILLVDDEPNILNIEKDMLEKLGYSLKVTNNAREALNLFEERLYQFDLVITDMTMPGMTGVEFAGELRKFRSDIPIIICTGFSESISKEKIERLGINGFLMKPVLLSDLAKIVRKVLDNTQQKSSHS